MQDSIYSNEKIYNEFITIGLYSSNRLELE